MACMPPDSPARYPPPAGAAAAASAPSAESRMAAAPASPGEPPHFLKSTALPPDEGVVPVAYSYTSMLQNLNICSKENLVSLIALGLVTTVCNFYGERLAGTGTYRSESSRSGRPAAVVGSGLHANIRFSAAMNSWRLDRIRKRREEDDNVVMLSGAGWNTPMVIFDLSSQQAAIPKTQPLASVSIARLEDSIP